VTSFGRAAAPAQRQEGSCWGAAARVVLAARQVPWAYDGAMTVVSLEPDLESIRRLVAAGELAAAAARCMALARAAPSDPRVWCLGAEIEFRSNRAAEGAELLRRAVACAPNDGPLLIHYGQWLLRLGRRRDALGIALQAQQLVPEHPQFQDALGSLLTHLEEPGRALQHFRAAVQGAPDNVDFRYNLAMAQRMVGDFEAAEVNLDEVIRARPHDGEAYNARSDLRKQTPERNHVSQLEALLRQSDGRRTHLPVAFALAKELEDLGQYSRSFEYLHGACRSYRASIRYDVADDVAVLDKLRTMHTAETLRGHSTGCDIQECIFIMGLPRSGTTLVERVLGSHSQVYSAGELDAFPRVVIDAVTRREGRPVKKLDFVERALGLDFEKLGRAYVEATRPRTGHTKRFTDKLPLNYLYAGLIHTALPRARFIALRRHPLDSCYSMYKTLFAAAYPFTYDLEDLSRYYVAWDRLMRHWESVLGEAWLTVSYEELVADQEGVSRRIVAHCGLDWEQRCLEFHTHTAPATTASAVQVRRPLYAESVGKWRRYENQLASLARHLESHGVPIR
jgi:tetratricopeptide (TPR) repeat protein